LINIFPNLKDRNQFYRYCSMHTEPLLYILERKISPKVEKQSRFRSRARLNSGKASRNTKVCYCCTLLFCSYPQNNYRFFVFLICCLYCETFRTRDSSVGIATRYGLDDPGIEIFRTRPDGLCGPPSLLYNGYRVFPGGKAAGAWC
jgi:hypothetical protein